MLRHCYAARCHVVVARYDIAIERYAAQRALRVYAADGLGAHIRDTGYSLMPFAALIHIFDFRCCHFAAMLPIRRLMMSSLP